jgi:hypothetical protein
MYLNVDKIGMLVALLVEIDDEYLATEDVTEAMLLPVYARKIAEMMQSEIERGGMEQWQKIDT